MLAKSIFKKHLNAHSIDELKDLFKQLQGVKQNNAKSAKKPYTKAWWKKGNEKIVFDMFQNIELNYKYQ